MVHCGKVDFEWWLCLLRLNPIPFIEDIWFFSRTIYIPVQARVVEHRFLAIPVEDNGGLAKRRGNGCCS